jgi:hypothetical protein
MSNPTYVYFPFKGAGALSLTIFVDFVFVGICKRERKEVKNLLFSPKQSMNNGVVSPRNGAPRRFVPRVFTFSLAVSAEFSLFLNFSARHVDFLTLAVEFDGSHRTDGLLLEFKQIATCHIESQLWNDRLDRFN